MRARHLVDCFLVAPVKRCRFNFYKATEVWSQFKWGGETGRWNGFDRSFGEEQVRLEFYQRKEVNYFNNNILYFNKAGNLSRFRYGINNSALKFISLYCAEDVWPHSSWGVTNISKFFLASSNFSWMVINCLYKGPNWPECYILFMSVPFNVEFTPDITFDHSAIHDLFNDFVFKTRNYKLYLKV